MTRYTAPIEDLQFILHDVLRIATSGLAGHDALDRATTGAILTAAGALATETLAPLNASGDREGCLLENGIVRTPTGFREAFARMRAGGWGATDCDPGDGGQGLPFLLNLLVGEIFSSANMALSMYQGLTHGAYSAIRTHGNAAQKALFLPRLGRCEWTGTMNLTEAHCGSDLGLLRTQATPAADGSYRITGRKVFVSSGDHDLAENVIHLVLARAPGGGEGTHGLSLFIVPKYLIGDDDRPAARNALSVGRIEAKMGIHANATCEMVYDGATGWLLGGLHKGMPAMFTMMNETRLGVGVQGYAVAEAAAQNAAHYARERLQGRATGTPANPDGPADPIIVHPDLRRLLMDLRVFTEGARAFAAWDAHLIDRARAGDDEAEGLVSLLTPVLKGFLTDKGFRATVQAQQIFGGLGYIEESGMPQFVRDARITMIYEGANGIQALDLVGRKIGAEDGRSLRAFFALVTDFIGRHGDDADLKAAILDPLAASLHDLQEAALWIANHGPRNPDDALAGASDFLHLFGHVAFGFMWARMAVAAGTVAAGTNTDGAGSDADFRAAKRATARYFMARWLPATALHLTRIRSGAAPVMAVPPEAF